MTQIIPFCHTTIHIVASGTVITDPDTGVKFVVDDAGGVTNHRTGTVHMTQRTYDALRSHLCTKTVAKSA